ncbi:ATP-dependent helicase, partial [Klebsiella pneumoniae]
KRRERLQQMGKKPDQDLFPPPSASINYEPPEGSDGQLIIEAKRKLQKNVNSASQ